MSSHSAKSFDVTGSKWVHVRGVRSGRRLEASECSVPTDSASSRARNVRKQRQRAGYVDLETSPLTPAASGSRRQTVAACGSSRRYRRFMNELYLRLSAVHYGSVGGLGTEALDSPLDTWEVGVERPPTEAAWLHEFWTDMRERHAESPQMERVLRGMGDAWHFWEPFRECTEEEERILLDALSSIRKSVSARHRSGEARTPEPPIPGSRQHRTARSNALESQMKALHLGNQRDNSNDIVCEVESEEENFAAGIAGHHPHARVEAAEHVFPLDEDCQVDPAPPTSQLEIADANEVSRLILAFFRLSYATRELLRRYSNDLWLLIAHHESILHEHGLVPHLNQNHLQWLLSPGRCPRLSNSQGPATGLRPTRYAASVHGLADPGPDSRTLTLEASSRLHRRILMALAAYHCLDCEPVQQSSSNLADVSSGAVSQTETHTKSRLRLALNQHRAASVTVPLAHIVYQLKFCDASVDRAVRRCVEARVSDVSALPQTAVGQ
ncbi:hypothetical protein CYME_CMQ447C [Cyanidioschyzon merolae strain 10D]|jgi:hypothetical protein|uniref:Uncharacterized protein n=1 Tax=Cyanidioschyzon merolae (strain NIES-3377 / 10D) TaxID=280699 RepID=M1UW16_CYAM1|nr:hypothetical protein CYME_CMQ447C [Cyanidioschyzon merolae strain 10D]BAM82276.1 hypothetical protein CYME_CMQ447C [Cyanidioschyzon merolae strain 10D]|eukprot:XP_005538312.1 hypothetical protein CYME_CMQ447C [Cyanidioschyzon merolae strain 10D]